MDESEDRRRWIGTRISFALTLGVAVLSVVTGVASIVTGFGSVFEFVPQSVVDAAGFTGTLTGFLMLASAFGLRRGLRAAWYAALVLLPVTALQGVIQSSPYSIPLVVSSVVALVVVAVNGRRFDRSLSLSTTQLAAGIALVGVQVYGTAGTYALREEFPAVNTVTDAFWYTLVTASTVGYGDISPATEIGKVFGISVVLLGTASFAIALGALLGPALEARFARVLGQMTDSDLELLENHVLVLGYGDLTEPIVDELRDGDVDFVVVTADKSRTSELSERDVSVITADPSDEEPLERARIEDARAIVVATNDDAQDALAILTARQLRPDARIVAAATDLPNVQKLRRAGADTVISPASIGGHLLVESALGSEDTERLADALLEDRSSDRPSNLEVDADADPSGESD
jgi:voltage-gated potassium channel